MAISANIETGLRAISERSGEASAFRLARGFLILAILVWLGYRLNEIGWIEVWDARPRSLWFYVIWIGLYIDLPVIESLIYRSLWGLPARTSLPALIQKRILNRDVVGLSGEGYLFLWARKRVERPASEIGGTIADNLIVASAAAWSVIILLLMTAVSIRPDPFELGIAAWSLVLAGAAFVIGVAALSILRHRLFTLPDRTVWRLLIIHMFRFGLVYCVLQVLQWWVVVPDAGIGQWLPMLVVVAAVDRVPLVPSKDLAGVAAVLGLVSIPPVFEAAVLAMLLTKSALDKASNLSLFLVNQFVSRKAGG